MTLLRFLLKYASLAPGVLALGLALMIIGCSGDSDKAVVERTGSWFIGGW